VLAHEDNRLYGDVLSATSAIVFFGTPHRGSKGADIGKVVGRVVNICLRVSQTAGIAGSVRDDLLTTLGSNSQALSDLAISSRNRLRNLEIVTFHETETLPGFSELVRILQRQCIFTKQCLICLEYRSLIKTPP
jgi:hypothetical protein